MQREEGGNWSLVLVLWLLSAAQEHAILSLKFEAHVLYKISLKLSKLLSAKERVREIVWSEQKI